MSDFILNMIKNFIKKLRKINLLSLKRLKLFIFNIRDYCECIFR